MVHVERDGGETRGWRVERDAAGQCHGGLGPLDWTSAPAADEAVMDYVNRRKASFPDSNI